MSRQGESAEATVAVTTGAVKFLCDGMLTRLGRFLRAAGYDTDIAGPGEHDGALLARAVREDRLLLTCDRELAQRRAAVRRVIVLPSNGLDRTARALGDAVPIDWLRAPFTRCLVDNSPLRPAAAEEHDLLPKRAREIGDDDIFVCPQCSRIYWPGSHVRRIRQRLAKWNQSG
jgi:uncharacterized protein with PIN domain